MSDLMLLLPPVVDDMIIDKSVWGINCSAGDDRFEFMKGKPKPKPVLATSTSFACEEKVGERRRGVVAVGIKFLNVKAMHGIIVG